MNISWNKPLLATKKRKYHFISFLIGVILDFINIIKNI